VKETPDTIHHFWFSELTPADWFSKNDQLDEMIAHRFGVCHQTATRVELYFWRETAKGRLAEIIVLDQFSRNIHRGRAEAFKNDMMALTLAQEIVLLEMDDELSVNEKIFAYMPFMHSESRFIHESALELFENLEDEDTLMFELLHKEIIDRFGRYPHRNNILGRMTTPRESEFLKTHSGF